MRLVDIRATEDEARHGSGTRGTGAKVTSGLASLTLAQRPLYRDVRRGAPSVAQLFQGVFTLGDARSFLALTSKIPPLGSVLNFDAGVKKTTTRHSM